MKYFLQFCSSGKSISNRILMIFVFVRKIMNFNYSREDELVQVASQKKNQRETRRIVHAKSSSSSSTIANCKGWLIAIRVRASAIWSEARPFQLTAEIKPLDCLRPSRRYALLHALLPKQTRMWSMKHNDSNEIQCRFLSKWYRSEY